MKNILITILSLVFSLSTVIVVQRISMLSDIEVLEIVADKERLKEVFNDQGFNDKVYDFNLLYLLSGYFAVLVSSVILFFVLKFRYKAVLVFFYVMFFPVLVRLDFIKALSFPLNSIAAWVFPDQVVGKIFINALFFLIASICSLIALVRIVNRREVSGNTA